MVCAYCESEIIGSYLYKWFPKYKKMLPIHTEHISIKSKGLDRMKSLQSLKDHLEATREAHNGYAYEDLEKLYKSGVNVANLAYSFKVSRPTMYAWLELLGHKTKQGTSNE